MNNIFIDLEFCEVDKVNKLQRKLSRFEIIEMGAVKLNEENEICDSFHRLVKPQFGSISNFVFELTNISNRDVDEASSFSKVMDDFLNWVGDDQTTIYSWSKTDWLQIQNECIQKKYYDKRLECLYENWIDFQMIFGKILGIDQQISLVNALNGVGLIFEGQAHSALADAENTAKLFILSKNEDKFYEQAEDIIELMKPKPALTVCMGTLFTKELLQALSV